LPEIDSRKKARKLLFELLAVKLIRMRVRSIGNRESFKMLVKFDEGKNVIKRDNLKVWLE
jgi:hypothetical protein